MRDYEAMYLRLFNQVSDAVRILWNAQQEAERILDANRLKWREWDAENDADP